MLTLGHKYSYLFILVTGFVLGIYFCSLFNGCGHSATPGSSTAIVKPEVLQKQVVKEQAAFQGKLDSLGSTARNLAATLQTTRSSLDKVKQKNLVLQTQVYDLLDRRTAAGPDTVTAITLCDSLQGKVKDLVINDEVRDSLYEVATGTLQNELSNKDSTLRVQQDQYQAMKASFTQSIQQEQVLQTENTALRKSVRHQKVKGIFRTIGMVLAAALAAHYLSH